MKRDLGPLPLIGAILAGVVVIGAVVYFGFMQSGTPGYSSEEQRRNDAMVEISDQRAAEISGSLGGQPAAGGANPEAAARSGTK